MLDPQLPVGPDREGASTRRPAGTEREPPDRGGPVSRVVALVSAIVLYGILAVSQNVRPPLDPAAELGREPRGGEVAKLFLLVERGLEEAGLGGSG
ncbi:MAG TPA: hypothetical protein VFF69_15235, partial [Phycisphaerales bacterium]|nr:hypothetical protein [Phycisphaerales bacterium]